jgi:RNA polymerase sigma-70 factor (ECF subfamily)
VIESVASDEFTDFARDLEPRLKHALAAALGAQRGLEAAADALAYGWEHWDRIKTMDNRAGYLYRVGYHKGIRRRPLRPELPAVPNPTMPWIEPGLPRALARLSAKQRVAVLLIHSFEWTYSEVADVLGVSIGTVETHVERGMKKLRLKLGGAS